MNGTIPRLNTYLKAHVPPKFAAGNVARAYFVCLSTARLQAEICLVDAGCPYRDPVVKQTTARGTCRIKWASTIQSQQPGRSLPHDESLFNFHDRCCNYKKCFSLSAFFPDRFPLGMSIFFYSIRRARVTISSLPWRRRDAVSYVLGRDEMVCGASGH